MKACNGNKKTPIVAKTPREEGIEITRLEPVVIEVEQGEEVISHLILFEIKAKLNIEEEGLVIDGDIKETIFLAKEF
ncbi:hypothetical protein JW826_04270 [Candidatus Woesearchaeota archaeon]|nr:hypothetical protein [Candidatus Woesearchaeota archaeon]